MDVFYRYTDYRDTVQLEEHKVVRRTPCGVWVRDPYAYPEKLRFVNLSARKQYANATKEEAKTAFLARKNRQLRFLRAHIAAIESAVERLTADEIDLPCTVFGL